MTEQEAQIEQAWHDLDAKIEQARARAEARLKRGTVFAHEEYVTTLLRSAGAELARASESLAIAAEQLKWAHKGKASNMAIEASRRARDAAKGLV